MTPTGDTISALAMELANRLHKLQQQVQPWWWPKEAAALIESALARQAERHQAELVGYQIEADRILRERVESEERLEAEVASLRAERDELHAAILGPGGWDERCRALRAELERVGDARAIR